MKNMLFILTATLMLCFAPYTQAQINDQTLNIAAAQCPGVVSGNSTGTNGLTIVGASNAPVFQLQTSNSGTNTHTYTCELTCPSRTSQTKGCTVNAFSFYYGVQTTAFASQTAPACGLITLPQPAASETPSTVTPVSQTVTVLPVIGSANLGTTTAGAFVTSTVFFSTPVVLNGTQQKLVCTFAFPNTATSATVSQTFGGTLFWTNNPI